MPGETEWLRLATKRSAGVTPEVNIREYVTCVPLPSMNKAALKTQRRHQQNCKTGVSVVPQKGLNGRFQFQNYENEVFV